jgi:hypothetical protein
MSGLSGFVASITGFLRDARDCAVGHGEHDEVTADRGLGGRRCGLPADLAGDLLRVCAIRGR